MSYRGYPQAYPQGGRCQGCPNASYDNYPSYDESRYVTPRSSSFNGVGSPRRHNYQGDEYYGVTRRGHEHTYIPGAHQVPCPPGSVHWGNVFGGGCTGLGDGGVTMADGAMSPRSRNRGPVFSPCQQGYRGCGQNQSYGGYR